MAEKTKWPKRYSKPSIYAVKMCPEQVVLSCCSQTPGTIGAKMDGAYCYGVDAGPATYCGITNVTKTNWSTTPS